MLLVHVDGLNVKYMKEYKFKLGVLLIIILIFFVTILFLSTEIEIFKKENGILKTKYDSLLSIKHKQDSLCRDHMKDCALISKDQLKYGKDNIVYIKDTTRLTFDLGD